MLLLHWLLNFAFGHSGTVPARGVADWSGLPDLEPGGWIVWEFYPSIVLGCLLFSLAYEWVAGPLRRKYNLSPVGPTRRQRVSFHLGTAVVFISLQGPLHELSDVYLFSGHMVQHLSITLLFPPLMLLGVPGWMWDGLFRIPVFENIARVLTKPLVAGLIATGTLYLWHVPGMYDWALEDHNVHIVEHLSFMATAVIMWWPAFTKSEKVPALAPGSRMVYLFLLGLPMKFLGAVITMPDDLLYRFYATQPRVFGLDPMEDQRLGGLIMWVPGGLVFWISIAWIFFTHYYRDDSKGFGVSKPRPAQTKALSGEVS